MLSAVLLGILWGAVGGLLGTYYVVRGELQPGFLDKLLPATARDVSPTIFVALRPLALALAVATVAGTLAWTAETLLKSNLREGRSTWSRPLTMRPMPSSTACTGRSSVALPSSAPGTKEPPSAGK